MTETTESTLATVDSRDGTKIGYWTSGQGPPLVLVHGMTADHTRWAPLLPYLEPKFTVHAVDRRGRGASEDGRDYALEREVEDVAAVVDAVAAASGNKVDVYGHSSGGLYSFGAATLTPNIGRLVLYEGWPSVDPRPMIPASFIDQLDALLAEGDPEGVVEAIMRDVVHMSEDDLAAYRSLPAWRQRVAAAHTIPREMRTESQARLDLQTASGITVPVLMVVGQDSPDAMKRDYEDVAAALPNAQITVIDGQQHTADVLAPGAFAELLIAFLGEEPRGQWQVAGEPVGEVGTSASQAMSPS